MSKNSKGFVFVAKDGCFMAMVKHSAKTRLSSHAEMSMKPMHWCFHTKNKHNSDWLWSIIAFCFGGFLCVLLFWTAKAKIVLKMQLPFAQCLHLSDQNDQGRQDQCHRCW
jgi:hypothetical protein